MSEAPLTLRELDSIPVVRLRGVGERKREALAAVGVETVLDLLTTYPRRWVDRTNEARVSDLVPGTEALVLVSVRSTSKRMGRNRRTIVETVVGDGTGRMHVVFFNQPWRERQLTPGLEVALYGKVDTYRGGLQMANPVVDLIGDRTGRIVPIYPAEREGPADDVGAGRLGRERTAACRGERLRRPRAGACPAAPRAARPWLGAARHPRARVDRRQGAGTTPARLRRAAARAGRPRHAQAGDGAGVGRHPPPAGRRAGRAVPRRPAVPADSSAAPGDRRDRGRPRPSTPDAPPAAG